MYTHILGNPRIGPNRELKFAIEKFWKNNSFENLSNLINTKKKICHLNWNNQINLGLDYINVGDFSFYDHILNNLIYLGCLPSRFNFDAKNISLEEYFQLARGNKKESPMELTKWFNTNYHYLVPEYNLNTTFSIKNNWLFEDIKESKKFNYPTKICILGPISILKIGKIKDLKLKNRLLLLPDLILNYIDFINKINSLDINFIQIEEPILSINLSKNWLNAFNGVYKLLSKYFSNLILTTYFGEVIDNIKSIFLIENIGLHLDIYNYKINFLKEKNINNKFLSLGIVDGKNIWKNDLEKSYYLIKNIKKYFNNILISTTTSLLHVPVDSEKEYINKNIKNWISFGKQKIKELVLLKNILEKKNIFLSKDFIKNLFFIENKKKSSIIYNNKIQNLIINLNKTHFDYRSEYNTRKIYQKIYLNLPLLVKTTIGSFPQTIKLRKLRSDLSKNIISKKYYESKLKKEIKFCIKKQNYYNLDVLVHGEFERNDMVEYFANLLNGFIVTEFGWVQSYGSRCVKPPIIYGDIYMSKYMSVKWIKYSQKMTKKYVKGMLTGPITMIKWSFCRNDQPLYITALQIALALKYEILELEKNNIKIIQIDEPALRELLPLNLKKYNNYFNWARKSFLLTNNSVKKSTQIHTHICYSEFKSILNFIKNIDVDVVSIEASRSNMNLLSILPIFINEIGVGIYDIHSDRKLFYKDSLYLTKLIFNHLNKNSIWVNPDCGLKTRNWNEINYSMKNINKSILKIKNDLNI